MSARADDFTLDDQFGRPHAVRFAEAPLTLVVFAGAAAAGDAEAWGRRVREAARAAGAGEVRVVAVAAVGAVPGLVRPLVRRALAGRPPLPLDWGDAVAARFGYAPGAARAVLVDAAGRVRAAASGPATDGAVAAFAAAALSPPAPAA